jgi:lipid-binding SYLF domain-containing protein
MKSTRAAHAANLPTASRLLAPLVVAFFVASGALVAPSAALAQTREEKRVETITQVLAETQAMPDQQIPDWLLQRAQGIAVIPEVLKVGLGIGGRGGRGVLLVRQPDGGWSNPSFITLAGGSFGWQAGVQSSDIVLVFTTRKGVEGITGGKFTLGADASVAVGPVGRQVSGGTDVTLDAEVYSYSRAKGLFGGLAIDGTVLSIDHRANAAYYGRAGVLASEIFSGQVQAPASARTLKTQFERMGRGLPVTTGAAPAAAATGGTSRPAGSAPAPATSGTAATPEAEPRGLESGGAATFPLDGERPRDTQPPR